MYWTYCIDVTIQLRLFPAQPALHKLVSRHLVADLADEAFPLDRVEASELIFTHAFVELLCYVFNCPAQVENGANISIRI
jgi:hypothetical protein